MARFAITIISTSWVTPIDAMSRAATAVKMQSMAKWCSEHY